jgi:hypothetical protein
MNLAKRTVVLAGLGLAAAAAFGASPASAAPATTAAPAAQTAAAPSWDRVIGYYNNPGLCSAIGRAGVRNDRWDYYECNRVRRGGRIFWQLRAGERRGGHGNGHGPVIITGPGHGHGGDHGHGGPGHGGHGDHGHGHGGHGFPHAK